MLEFRKLTLADRAWVHEILYRADRHGCEYSFANLYLWICRSGGVARVGDFICPAVFGKKRSIWLWPAGEGDVFPVLEELRRDAMERGLPFVLAGVTEEDIPVLEGLYPGKFAIEFHRDSCDYRYPIEKLCELSGKKLQSKRNHINRFLQEHPAWRTEEITEENLPLCRKITADWAKNHEDGENEVALLEHVFSHREEMGMEGILLLDGDTPLGFSMGNRITETMFDVNFEKAYADVQGAYPLVNREFARYVRGKYPEITTLNREDDMGLEGLRKAKESYHPDLLRKHRATWEGEG